MLKEKLKILHQLCEEICDILELGSVSRKELEQKLNDPQNLLGSSILLLLGSGKAKLTDDSLLHIGDVKRQKCKYCNGSLEYLKTIEAE